MHNEISRNYQKIEKNGSQEIPKKGGGSHRKWYNPRNNAIVAIPDWGNKDLKIGTLRQIIRQLDLSLLN